MTDKVRCIVSGFLPSKSGLHFSNQFPPIPLLTINILGVQVPIGNASKGLCGGMAFTARDYFEAGLPPSLDKLPPASGPLFDHLVRRLFDSFNLPLGPTKYMHLMNPALPDHETWASRVGLAPRGRAWVMINEEWPKIKADLDSGHPSPLGLITIKSLDPFQMGHNHQILAYGYELDHTDLVIYVYDPNAEDNDNITISLSIADPQNTTSVTYSGTIYGGDHVIWCFFRPDYSFVRPPIVDVGMTANIHLKVNNGKYISAEKGGGGTVVANRDIAKEWETFQLVDRNGPPLRSGDEVALRANNGQFICAEGGGGQKVVANRDAIKKWETFTVLRVDGSGGEISDGQQVALRANNGQFICAEGGGGQKVVANRNAIGPWETFTIEIIQP